MSRTGIWPIYKRLSIYLKPFALIFGLSVLANAGYSAIDAGMVKLLQPLIDDVFVARDQGLVRLIPLLLPLAFLLRGILSFSSDYGMAFVSRNVVANVRCQVFEHLQKLGATFYDHSSSGQILAKLTYNVDQIAKASTDVIVDIVRSTLLIVFLLGVMFWTSWRLSLIFIVVCPLVAFLFSYASKRFRKISHNIQDSIADVSHLIEENVEGYQVVRTYNGQRYEIEQFRGAVEKNRGLEMKMVVTRAFSQPLIQFVGGLGLALTVYFATSNYSPEVLTAGAFATLMTAMVSMLNPIKQLTSVSNKIQQGIAGAESIFALLDEPPEPDNGHVNLKKVEGKIEFKEVTFTYPGLNRPVLKNVSFTIEPGETVAFVGPSGAGKSTIVSLLLRFYDDYQGSILVDGTDIRDYTLESLRKHFAMVSQHVSLFNDSIANNIAYGRLGQATHHRIVQSAEIANAMSFIQALPQGLNTKVGENGVLLSGGQRQRLAIARALCKQSPFLIFDEATSSLDTESERLIQMALERVTENKTTLVVAHRLSTIEKANKIIVMDGGKLVEEGSHQALIEKSGLYTRLHTKQCEDEVQPLSAVEK